ncbi:claudin-1 [Gadus chalcogrammus]|uniref:claudin-1 n=1 Tax=Gadus chalcogrammus TaxID=1042646 RepID=UPI0024C4C82A|nr:claudin-1 [Gadus chalcogrammus]
MASSGIQLFGFLLAVVGLAAIVTATCMVEWTTFESSEEQAEIYGGLWETCRVTSSRMSCKARDSFLELSWGIQVTRAVLISSICLSSLAVLVSIWGMKCTRFMEDREETKRFMALSGGVMFMISGLLALVVTSWYVGLLIEAYKNAHHLDRYEFGNAAFVSWVGSILSLVGGAFLNCRRCFGTRSSLSPAMIRQSAAGGAEYV